MNHTITLHNESDTVKLAQDIAKNCTVGDVVLLEGQLGVGKTLFAKAFINALSSELQNVTSPTFTLQQIYDGINCEIHHYDLYRLESLEDALELGIEDSFDNAITIIEWPQIISKIAPENSTHIIIEYGEKENQRIVKITP